MSTIVSERRHSDQLDEAVVTGPISGSVGICFDADIETACLQIFVAGKTKATSTSPDSTLPPATTETALELSTIGMNFILALEHPCLTHFTAPSTVFDMFSPPSNHEMMASTHFYANAPLSIFKGALSRRLNRVKHRKHDRRCQQHHHDYLLRRLHIPTSSSSPSSSSPLKWPVPALSLQNLYSMSRSLPQGDWEITPVQAWFLLVERVGERRLLAHGGRMVHELKRRLATLVGCWKFGAVLDETRFWRITADVLRKERRGQKELVQD